MTATGEYTQFFGSVALANAGVTTTVIRVTGIYEREVAIRRQIVFFNTYADPTTDPTTDPFPSPISRPLCLVSGSASKGAGSPRSSR